MSVGTYTQLHIHCIIAVKGRHNLIAKAWQPKLLAYITGVVQAKGHKMLCIDGMPDHIHFLIGLRPADALSDLIREVKKASNAWIRQEGYARNFYWQEGYGAFAVSKSGLDAVIDYIRNQEQHHAKRSFKEEYISFLQKHEIAFDEKYLFDWIAPES